MNLYGYDWPQGGTKQIAYVNGQSHMMELFVGFGDLWQSADLTVLTGAPPPDGSAFAGYAWSTGGTKQVAYRDQKSHIIELFVARDSPWQWVDLTVLTGAPAPGDSALAGYAWSAGGTKQVAYVDDQGHVIELFVARDSPWQWVDLTALTGAPPPGGPALAGYDWPNGQTKQVAYVDDQGHVIELFVARGSPWQWVDLTALTGAPLLHQKPLTGYAWVWGATKQVAYVDDHGHMIELHVGLSDQWRCSILTAFKRHEAPGKPG